MIDFRNIFNEYKKVDLESEEKTDSYSQLCSTGDIDAVSYKIKKSSNSIQAQNDGTFRVEFTLERNKGDLFTDFEIDVPGLIPFKAFYFIVGQKKIHLFKETLIPIVCSMYLPINIQVELEKNPEKVELSYKAYVLQSKIREKIMHEDIIVNNEVRYRDGMATCIY